VNDSELQELHQVHTEAYAQITVALANARFESKQKDARLADMHATIEYLRSQLTQTQSPGDVIDGNVA
jgi:hypothetical protein